MLSRRRRATTQSLVTAHAPRPRRRGGTTCDRMCERWIGLAMNACSSSRQASRWSSRCSLPTPTSDRRRSGSGRPGVVWNRRCARAIASAWRRASRERFQSQPKAAQAVVAPAGVRGAEHLPTRSSGSWGAGVRRDAASDVAQAAAVGVSRPARGGRVRRAATTRRATQRATDLMTIMRLSLSGSECLAFRSRRASDLSRAASDLEPGDHRTSDALTRPGTCPTLRNHIDVITRMS